MGVVKKNSKKILSSFSPNQILIIFFFFVNFLGFYEANKRK
jgi:hypothetical protein